MSYTQKRKMWYIRNIDEELIVSLKRLSEELSLRDGRRVTMSEAACEALYRGVMAIKGSLVKDASLTKDK